MIEKGTRAKGVGRPLGDWKFGANMKIISCLSMSSVFILVSCTSISTPPPTTTRTEKPYTVKIKTFPRSNPGSLKAHSFAQGWGRLGKKRGYVGYDRDEYGDITLQLHFEDENVACPEVIDSKTENWVITQVALSGSGDLGTEKGTRFGESQDRHEWLKQAFPAVDLATGYVFNVDIANFRTEGRTTVVIHDANEQEGEKFIYYRVTARSCTDGRAVELDPGFGNRGK